LKKRQSKLKEIDDKLKKIFNFKKVLFFTFLFIGLGSILQTCGNPADTEPIVYKEKVIEPPKQEVEHNTNAQVNSSLGYYYNLDERLSTLIQQVLFLGIVWVIISPVISVIFRFRRRE